MAAKGSDLMQFKVGDRVVVVRGPRAHHEDYRDNFIGHVGVIQTVYDDDGGYYVVRFGPDVPGAYATGFRAADIELGEGMVKVERDDEYGISWHNFSAEDWQPIRTVIKGSDEEIRRVYGEMSNALETSCSLADAALEAIRAAGFCIVKLTEEPS